MWCLKLLLAVCITVAAKPEAKDREKRWLSWAEILGGEPPKPLETTIPVEKSLSSNIGSPFSRIQDYENAISDSTKKDYETNHPNHDSEDDYEYDDSFFNNDYYEYVDTEDENFTPPSNTSSEGNGEVSQNADRRTLDFFYHLFNDQFRTDQSSDGRPQRDTPTTTRRPSLIEAVFKTIDNHIIEDLQEWATYSAQRDAQAANTEKPLALPQVKPAIGVPASVQTVSPDNNIVLVTDDLGNQHVVTIDEIVSSLGQLDEKTLTNLLLSPPPQAISRSSDPSINLDVAESQIVQTQVPLVLGAHRGGQMGIQRPTRHTEPTKNSGGDDDVYVVQDENGEIRVVTINDIISSLAVLNDDGLNKLLFEDATIPAVPPPTRPKQIPVAIPPSRTKQVPSTTPRPTTTTSLPDPPTVSPKEQISNENSTSKKPLPKVTTDFNGNIRVLAHPGTVKLDLKDSSWDTEEQQPKEAESERGPVIIDGSTIATDNKGNIHITPDPSRPFTLDIKNIIALAEQADGSYGTNKPAPSKITKNPIKEENEKKEKDDKPRGYEILSYLAGVDDFLPAAVLPGPISFKPTNTAGTNDPAGVDSFRSSLLQAIAQQRQVPQTTTPQPVQQPLLQRLMQPVVQPLVQPIVQAVTQPLQQPSANGGIGATLSRLLSNFVGQSPTHQAVAIPQTQEKSPEEEEYIKLVVRQQAQNSDDTHFGDITIPLPKPIHFQPTSTTSTPVTNTATTQISPRVDASTLLKNLAPAIRQSLIQQANNVPRFIPPGAQSRVATQRSLPTASSRSDSGSIIRTDRNIANTYNHRNSISPVVKPYNINPRPVLYTVTAPPTTEKPVRSVSEILSGLPKPVLDSIRKQVQNARFGSSQEQTTETPKTEIEEEVEEEPKPHLTEQLDRSSYAHHPPAYGGGYGYGSGVGATGTNNPLFDIYFLADLTKVHKLGDANLSIKSPIIGDPSYFVKTRPEYGYYR